MNNVNAESHGNSNEYLAEYSLMEKENAMSITFSDIAATQNSNISLVWSKYKCRKCLKLRFIN